MTGLGCGAAMHRPGVLARKPGCRWAVMALIGLTLSGGAWAQTTARRPWLTAPALQKAFDAVIPRAFWSGVPLRQVMQSISDSQRVAILMDRRVDPGQTIDVEFIDATLKEVVERIAADRGLGVSVLGPVVYVGPPHVAARLRTLAQLRRDEVDQLPAEAGKVLRRAEPMAWDDFAVPRDLLGQLAAQAGIAVVGLEQVPHDLWAAAQLPPLPLVDRLTLIAVQFDLTFEVPDEGRRIALVPMPDKVAILRRYPGGPHPQQLAQLWATRVPEAQIQVVGGELLVRGLVEDHERITGRAQPPRRTAVKRPAASSPEAIRYTIRRTTGPLDRLLDELGRKLHAEVRLDRQALAEAGIAPDQIVSFSVEQATMDEVFQAVLAPAGCTFRRKGNVIEVFPAK